MNTSVISTHHPWSTVSHPNQSAKPPKRRFAGREAQMHPFGSFRALDIVPGICFAPWNNLKCIAQKFTHWNWVQSGQLWTVAVPALSNHCTPGMFSLARGIPWSRLTLLGTPLKSMVDPGEPPNMFSKTSLFRPQHWSFKNEPTLSSASSSVMQPLHPGDVFIGQGHPMEQIGALGSTVEVRGGPW